MCYSNICGNTAIHQTNFKTLKHSLLVGASVGLCTCIDAVVIQIMRFCKCKKMCFGGKLSLFCGFDAQKLLYWACRHYSRLIPRNCGIFISVFRGRETSVHHPLPACSRLFQAASRTSLKWWSPETTSWPSIRTLWRSWSSRITTDSPQSPNSNQRTLTMSSRCSQTVCTCRTQTSP